MKLLLKIINLSPSSEFVRVDFGKGYDFHWDNKQRGFIYAPANQTEIEEIYSAIAAYGSPWVVVPVMEGAPSSEPAAPLPPDEREAQAAYIASLQATITSSADTIAKLREAAKADADTIALLRADLKAQQDKAVAAATPPPEPAPKTKPSRKPKGAPAASESTDSDDIPTD